MALPASYRNPLYLFYYEDYSIKEIAKRHGVTEGCIKTNLCRNRKKLYRILKQEVLT